MISGNPEGALGLIKVLARDGDGERAIVIAEHNDGLQVIALVVAGPDWGRLVLARETRPDHWPSVVRRVVGVPDVAGWTLVVSAAKAVRMETASKQDCLASTVFFSKKWSQIETQ